MMPQSAMLTLLQGAHQAVALQPVAQVQKARVATPCVSLECLPVGRTIQEMPRS